MVRKGYLAGLPRRAPGRGETCLTITEIARDLDVGCFDLPVTRRGHIGTSLRPGVISTVSTAVVAVGRNIGQSKAGLATTHTAVDGVTRVRQSRIAA